MSRSQETKQIKVTKIVAPNEETTMPEKINVIRSITYDVPSIVDSLKEMGEKDINIDNVMECIKNLVEEDMASPISRHDITYLDENGEDLEYGV